MLLDDRAGAAAVRRVPDPGEIVERVHLAEPDVLPHGELVAHEVLEDDAEALVQAGQVVLAQVHAVEQHLPLRRVVQPREQLDQRRLAGAVQADQRDALAGLDVQVDVAQHIDVGAGVAERDVPELDALADGRGRGQAVRPA